MNVDSAEPSGPGDSTDLMSGARGNALAELTQPEYDLFASVARPRRVYAGETLFRRGDLGTTMFIISQGSIELDFGDDLLAKRLGPREFFGELGLLIGDHARSAEATVLTDGLLLELRHAGFQALVDRDPGRVSHFLRRAIMRVVLNEQSLIRRLRRRNRDLQAAIDTLRSTTQQLGQAEALTRTDELTGLTNRRGLMQHIDDRRRNGALGNLGLLLIDCDCFKTINDAHGHLVGDRVLQGVAGILRSVAGVGDVACRLGGDEFCLLVKATTRDDVLRYAEFVQTTARGLMQISQGPPLICSLSIGACLVESTGDWPDWCARADAALYRAKRLGGDRAEWQDAPVTAAAATA